ncbi:ABC transporter substrate-binding protein [Candidatus Bathyarchaeota archaeon]|nr:MAG: ABC transporter substrate-binding protein [Candidatus Bathyarchaeota archaeon]
MLFIKRGYLLLLTGTLIGFLCFSIISLLYSGIRQPQKISGIPSRIEIDFLYTSEKQGWIKEVTPKFEKWFKQRFGIEIHVNQIVTGSHDTVNRILDGSTRPTVWSPASSIWIPYLNAKWRNITGSNYDIAVEWTPIVLSPLVLAGWRSISEHYQVKGFIDLYRLIQKGVDFKYGHPDPQLSNGGIMTVILEFAEAAGKRPEDLTIGDLKNKTVIQIVKAIESKAVYYGKSTGFFGAYAAENGPNEINFFGIYESVVLENSLKALKKWNDSIVAIYPEMGTLMADHPFVILNGSWVTPWQRFAAGQYLFFLLLPENQELAEKHGFRPAISSVPLDEEIFNQLNGVKYEIDVPILKAPKGEVMEAIFKAWIRVRNIGL